MTRGSRWFIAGLAAFWGLGGACLGSGAAAFACGCSEASDDAALRILERAADELVVIAETPRGDVAAALVRWQVLYALSLETALEEAVRTMTPARRTAFQERWAAIAARLRARLER